MIPGRRPVSAVARLGEDVAAAFLERRGAVIVGRNVAVGAGEIDLIVSFGRGLVVVEVKTIGPAAMATHPIDRLTDEKLRQVRSLAGELAGGDCGSLQPGGSAPSRQRDTQFVVRIDFVGVRLTHHGAVVNWRTALA